MDSVVCGASVSAGGAGIQVLWIQRSNLLIPGRAHLSVQGPRSQLQLQRERNFGLGHVPGGEKFSSGPGI